MDPWGTWSSWKNLEGWERALVMAPCGCFTYCSRNAWTGGHSIQFIYNLMGRWCISKSLPVVPYFSFYLKLSEGLVCFTMCHAKKICGCWTKNRGFFHQNVWWKMVPNPMNKWMIGGIKPPLFLVFPPMWSWWSSVRFFGGMFKKWSRSSAMPAAFWCVSACGGRHWGTRVVE